MEGDGGAKNRKAKRKRVRWPVVLSIGIAVMIGAGLYGSLLFQADLLISWDTPGTFLTSGTSTYYVINSRNGRKTYVPKLFVRLLGEKDQKAGPGELREWQAKIRESEPEFSGNATVAGWLEDNVLIFTVNTGDYLYNVYRYDILADEYEIITSQQSILQCLAGEGKIFYRTPMEYLLPDNSVPLSQAFEPIYRYDPGSGEAVKIGEYIVHPKTMRLVRVIK